MGINDDSFIHTISIYFPSIFHNFRPLGLVEDASKEHWAVDLVVVVVVEEGLASQQNCGVSAWISGRWDHHGPPHRRLLGFLLWLTLGTAAGVFPLQRKSGDRTSHLLAWEWSIMIIHDHSWSITCKPSSIYVATSLVTSLTLSQVLNPFAWTLFSLVRGGWWRKTCQYKLEQN